MALACSDSTSIEMTCSSLLSVTNGSKLSLIDTAQAALAREDPTTVAEVAVLVDRAQ